MVVPVDSLMPYILLGNEIPRQKLQNHDELYTDLHRNMWKIHLFQQPTTSVQRKTGHNCPKFNITSPQVRLASSSSTYFFCPLLVVLGHQKIPAWLAYSLHRACRHGSQGSEGKSDPFLALFLLILSFGLGPIRPVFALGLSCL